MQNSYHTHTEAPSNIAIVKYWGKQGLQEPMNPSLSFTLSKSITKTKLNYTRSEMPLDLEFLFEGKRKESFLPKLENFFANIKHLLPFIETGQLKIDSSNTFPHSSGIASSASSMAALAKALVEIHIKFNKGNQDKIKLESEIARLGSGSACRSTQPGWVLWGETPLLTNSSNQHGIELNEKVAPVFQTIQDCILVIRKGAKAVSSTMGHSLMDNHPYQQGRIKQANTNIDKLLKALKDGNFTSFAEVCEEEALSLHGLMMSSSPGFTLMAPETLRAIKRIRKFREHMHVPLTFTLDAGPNIHLLYPKEQSKIILPFVKQNLLELCEDNMVLYDEISMPEKILK